MRTNHFILVLAAAGSLFSLPPLCGSQAKPRMADELVQHERLAQQYLIQHQPSKAIPEFEAVVALDPGNTEARANLGVLLFFQDDFPHALPHLKAAVQTNPQLWKIRSLLGIVERRTGDDSSGRSDLEASFQNLTEEPLKVEVGNNLIESYSSTDDLDKAAATIAVLLKLRPADPALLYTSYRLHADMAVESLLSLSLIGPDSAQVHQAIAHELQRDRDLPGTIANLRTALALNPALPGIHFELAEALHASDDARLRAESIEQYRLAVQTNSFDPKAAARMGDILAEQGDGAAAAISYQRALQLQPGLAAASIGLANLKFDKGQYEQAASLLEGVEASDPTNVLAHYRLSAVYRKLGRPDDVKRELQLYQKYKDDREKLRALYRQLRLGATDNPGEEHPEPQ